LTRADVQTGRSDGGPVDDRGRLVDLAIAGATERRASAPGVNHPGVTHRLTRQQQRLQTWRRRAPGDALRGLREIDRLARTVLIRRLATRSTPLPEG
jgi:hypothetical protein